MCVGGGGGYKGDTFVFYICNYNTNKNRILGQVYSMAQNTRSGVKHDTQNTRSGVQYHTHVDDFGIITYINTRLG